MARKANQRPAIDDSGLIKASSDLLQDLLSAHFPEIKSFSEESEEQKVVVTAKFTWDFSKSEAAIKAHLRFSQAVTDERNATITDPRQGTFSLVPQNGEADLPPNTPDDEEEEAPKPRGRRKKDEAEAV